MLNIVSKILMIIVGIGLLWFFGEVFLWIGDRNAPFD